MADKDRERKAVDVILKHMPDRLDRYSEETMIPKTAVVERALEEYFNKFKDKTSS